MGFCVCLLINVCVCMCEREREKEGERECVCVCVCIHHYMCVCMSYYFLSQVVTHYIIPLLQMFSANEVITDCSVCSDSDFAKGIGESPPMIDEIANRKLLRRSVAAILAHMSFEGKLCG